MHLKGLVNVFNNFAYGECQARYFPAAFSEDIALMALKKLFRDFDGDIQCQGYDIQTLTLQEISLLTNRSGAITYGPKLRPPGSDE